MWTNSSNCLIVCTANFMGSGKVHRNKQLWGWHAVGETNINSVKMERDDVLLIINYSQKSDDEICSNVFCRENERVLARAKPVFQTSWGALINYLLALLVPLLTNLFCYLPLNIANNYPLQSSHRLIESNAICKLVVIVAEEERP